jgi:biopolymer transport protein ExbD
MKKSIDRRSAPEVNAGSMADIAFLLLIFFLVTTTIMSDVGILVKLPPWEPFSEPAPANARNILRVAINASDQILIESKTVDLDDVRDEAKNFIMNPTGDLDLAEAPNKAVVSLINDRSTSYDAYLAVYNELKAAYHELWEEAARRQFGQSYHDLVKTQQGEIRHQIPFVISEAEPTEHTVD